jgi:hypothetical protein
LSATGLGLALAATARQASAQDAATEMANHPIVGTWLVAPRPDSGYDSVVFGADGSVVQGFAASVVRPQGVAFSGPGIGTWEPSGPSNIAFTSVIVNSDAAGTNLGTTTIDGHLAVSEDGQSWVDDMSESQVTIRDAAGAIVQQIATAGSPPITAVRMRVKSPGFPEGTPVAGTPTP